MLRTDVFVGCCFQPPFRISSFLFDFLKSSILHSVHQFFAPTHHPTFRLIESFHLRPILFSRDSKKSWFEKLVVYRFLFIPLVKKGKHTIYLNLFKYFNYNLLYIPALCWEFIFNRESGIIDKLWLLCFISSNPNLIS